MSRPRIAVLGRRVSDRESGSRPPFEFPHGGEQLAEPQSDLYSGRSFTPKQATSVFPLMSGHSASAGPRMFDPVNVLSTQRGMAYFGNSS